MWFKVQQHRLLHKKNKNNYLFSNPTRKSRSASLKNENHGEVVARTCILKRPTYVRVYLKDWWITCLGTVLALRKLISKWTEMSWNRLLPGRQEINRRTCMTLGSNRKSRLFSAVVNGLKHEKPQSWSFKVKYDHVHQTLAGIFWMYPGVEQIVENSLWCQAEVCGGASDLPGRQQGARQSTSGCCSTSLMEYVSPVRICCCLRRLRAWE